MFFRKLPTFSPYFTQMSLNSALVQIILQAKKLWPKKTVLFKQQVKNENEIKYSKATLTELDDPVEKGFSLKTQIIDSETTKHLSFVFENRRRGTISVIYCIIPRDVGSGI